MDSQSEAGPSKPRTPPVTPPAKAKRSSWFGFGSSSPRAPVDQKRSVTEGEEVELSPVRRGSRNVSRGKTAGEGRSEARDLPSSGEELLTIDGDPEATVKKRKKKKRKSKADDEGEVLRLEDMSAKKGSKGDDGSLVSELLPEIRDPPRRVTSRRASDRSLRARASTDESPPPLPTVPPLSSRIGGTLNLSTPSPTIPIIYAGKPQPPPPFDRPLPPLPTANTDEKPLPRPQLPHGIVVTPSSPRKLVKTPRSASTSATGVTERRSRSASRSHDSTQTRKAHSRGASPIGLGLPVTLTGANGVNEPPPLPSKPQAVSSPHPSRSTSPSPKISFAEPGGTRYFHNPVDQPAAEEKKTRVKRARSLSGMFSRPSAASSSRQSSGTQTPDDGEQVLDDTGAAGAGKAQGVLEWLGVKKSVKRRGSEERLRDAARSGDESEGTAGAGLRPVKNENDTGTANRDSFGLDQDASAPTSILDLRPKRPQMRAQSSTATVVPQHPGKLSSIFTRRASTKAPETEGESSPGLPSAQAVSIPNAAQCPSTAGSSHSSLTLPPVDAAPSPGFFHPKPPWMSSPTSEAEETLFSPPPGAHWGPGIRPWMDETNSAHGSNSSPLSSPLGSMPEAGEIDHALPPSIAPPMATEGRGRSWSDAPLPSSGLRLSGSATHLAGQSGSQSLQPSPLTPSRPKMGSRSNSGNSAIIGRMKTVFSSKSTSRSRSNSLHPLGSGDVDEFGGLRGRSMTGGSRIRPSSSASSMTSNDIGTSRTALGGTTRGQNASLLELVAGERQVTLPYTPQRSPRTSFSGTVSSYATVSTHQSIVFEPGRDHLVAGHRTRARASTVSFAPSSHLPTPSSPGLFPSSATPPRHRPSVIHRFSSGLFGSGPSSPKGSATLFPLPPRSSGSISSSVTGGLGGLDDAGSGFLSPGTSPRPSVGSISGAMNGVSKQAGTRDGEESPDAWLERMTRTVGRNDIAGVLAAGGDKFHTEALKLYMARFDFTHNALDVALRRLLMQMSLPRETQQIDRVIEAFANRYEQCEPGLFEQKDNTYVLAFSMMMLHTDSFNRHNKNKMTKADYVRNTRMEGVSPIVLEAFYDNITFTPFVFIEDETDLKRNSGYESGTSLLGPGPGPIGFGTTSKSSKIDVYHMIVRGLLPTLRVDVEQYIPAENPFWCLGTRPFLDMDALHRTFTQAHSLQIPAPIPKKKGSSVLPEKLAGHAKVNGTSSEQMMLKITKIGLLSRKDDLTESSKKTNRKWKNWSVILTGSQLLFFKDPMWALTLLEQARLCAEDGSGNMLLPNMTVFKPDEVFPVKDCIAVFDRGYIKYPHTFRFVMPHSRQYLLQAPDEYEMNEWITLINHASTFKTAGIRMRASTMDKGKAVLAGAAAAASHRRETQGSTQSTAIHTPRRAVFGESAEGGSTHEEVPTQAETSATSVLAPMMGKAAVLDIAGANELALEDGERLEEVFDVVKAELAAGRGGAAKKASSEVQRGKKVSEKHVHLSRSEAIEVQIRHLEAKAAPLERQLSEHLRHARNLAILTPFQKITRDRVAAAVQPLAHRIRSDRLHLAKLRLWITVLRKDAERDTREWARVRHVALQAAAKSLRNPDGVMGVLEDVNNDGEGVPQVPKLSLPPESTGSPQYPDEPDEQGGVRQEEPSPDESVRLGVSPGELPIMFRRTSEEMGPGHRPGLSRHTSAGSSHSSPGSNRVRMTLMRSSSDLLSAGDVRRNREKDEGRAVESPMLREMPMLFPLSDAEEDGAAGMEAETTEAGVRDVKKDEIATHVRNGSDGSGKIDAVAVEERAEDWQNTKAARRVSLANLGMSQREMWRLSNRPRESENGIEGKGNDAKEEESGLAEAEGASGSTARRETTQ